MTDLIHDGSPLPTLEVHSFDGLNAKWETILDATRNRAMRWINQWRALSGGFSVSVQPGGELIIEPARIRGPSEGRGTRRRVERMIADLKAAPEVATAVQISTALVWYQTQTAKPAGTALQ